MPRTTSAKRAGPTDIADAGRRRRGRSDAEERPPLPRAVHARAASRAAPSSSCTGAAGRRTTTCTAPLRTQLADAGYSTLSIQMPVLPARRRSATTCRRFPMPPSASRSASHWLRAKGYGNVAIVSHSLGATMANHYLIRGGDPPSVPGSSSASSTASRTCSASGSRCSTSSAAGLGRDARRRRRAAGADREARPARAAGDRRPQHFFEGKQDELTRVIVGFLDRAL